MSKFGLSNPPKPLLSPENAHAAVMEIVGFYQVNLDAKKESEAEKLEVILDDLENFYALGYLENQPKDGSFSVVQHRQKAPEGTSKDVTYGELTGADRRKLKVKASGEMGAFDMQYALMATLSDTTIEFIASFRSPDFSVMEALADFFISF
jgi:hypothetical protein